MNNAIEPTKDKIAVSVVVPVYNAKEYISRCVDSIISQSLDNIEIILVDDGSTDGSSEICDDYAKRDHRVRVIHQKNSGSGAAYDSGLDAANGEYVAFVDNDDYIEPEMYETLYQVASKNDIDVVKSLYYMHSKRHEVGEKGDFKNPFDNSKNIFDKKITDRFAVVNFYIKWLSHWSSIYRRQLLKKYNIRFNDENLGASASDTGFVFFVFCYMSSVYITSKEFYHSDKSYRGKSFKKGYDSAIMVLKEHLYINREIRKRGIENNLIQLELTRSFNNLRLYLDRCQTFREKYDFLQRVSPLFMDYFPLLKTNKYLSKKAKKLYKRIVFYPKYAALINYKNKFGINIVLGLKIEWKKGLFEIRLFNIQIVRIRDNDKGFSIKLLYIPIYKSSKK